MVTTLLIRYADPDTTPSRYGHVSRSGAVIRNGYWALVGWDGGLREHLQAAIDDNNVNDYGWA